MRKMFLENTAEIAMKSYWESTEQLQEYDQTFARRIYAKWVPVIENTKDVVEAINQEVEIFDFGCGTGVASEVFLDFFRGKINISKTVLWDHANVARNFSYKKLSEKFLEIKFEIQKKFLQLKSKKILLISHVLNECAMELIQKNMDEADIVYFVEPGNFDASRKLGMLRNSVLEKFDIIFPCPHHMQCGMFDKKHKQDWCHFFAKVPQYFFHDSNWSKFSKEMKIDLRSLPYSCLVLTNKKNGAQANNRRERIVIGKTKEDKIKTSFMECRFDAEIEIVSLNKSK